MARTVDETAALTRDAFREGVLARDGGRCVLCGEPAVDAHHVMERRLFADGGYRLGNGASVCATHHLACERTLVSVEDVRAAAGISAKVLPEHLYPDQPYTKWGDPVLPNGRRMRGELFLDPSVQRVLAEGGVLHLYTPKVKYPRTWHLPWSRDVSADDRLVRDLSGFVGAECVALEKLDGGNVTGLNPACLDPGEPAVHARSTDSGDPPGMEVPRAVWACCGHDLPRDWRVVMENLSVRLSIPYEGLDALVVATSVWDETNAMLPYDETVEWATLLGLPTPRLLWRGTFDEAALRRLADGLDPSRCEGYVLRVSGRVPYGRFSRSVAKYVRADHNGLSPHGRDRTRAARNGMRPGATPLDAWRVVG